MATAARPPGPRFAHYVEWRARRIQDPVERLRFLRVSTRSRPSMAERFRRIGGWRLGVSVLLWASMFIPSYTPTRARGPVVPARAASSEPARFAAPVVWEVERTPAFDVYSNGLRIENEFAIAGKRRDAYPAFATQVSLAGAGELPVAWRSQPAGIVFHSTESHQVPFEASEVRTLKRLGRNLLDYIRAQQAYHFVIDRFGRVFRVVSEESIANHSGKSVWADATGTYVNLNASFLSIAFESQTGAPEALSAAQTHSAKVLTDMLRSRFNLPASNCVTHAQVSVNPANWRIGYHTDWASGFPFAELGLPDNYQQNLPSMIQFGFDYDDAFLAAARRPWSGMTAANALIDQQARTRGLSPAAYREQLQERYRTISAQMRSNEETQDEKYQ